jgi:hypothetical protein
MLALNSKLEEVQAPNGGKFAVWEGRIGASPKVENGQVVTDENGNIVYDLDYTITENYGTATIQFFVYGASNGSTDSVGVLATASTNFIIEKGVPVLLPMSFDEEGDVQQILAQILNILANTQTLYDNVDKALYGEEGTAESPTQNSIAGRLETAEEGITNLDNLVAANTLSINTQLGAEIAVQYNPPNGILTFALLNKEGGLLSIKTVDLPLESLIISGEYDAESKDIILRLQSGDTISVPVDELVDGLISTSEKGQPNGVASLDENRKVPESQLPTLDYVKRTGDVMRGSLDINAGGPNLKMHYGYEVTFGGNGFRYGYNGIQRLGENATFFAFPSDVSMGVVLSVRSDLAPLQRQLELHSQVLMQSGLVYTADDVNTWNERITADGLNVLDGSKAVLKKVVGSTVACKQLFDISQKVAPPTGLIYQGNAILVKPYNFNVGTGKDYFPFLEVGKTYTFIVNSINGGRAKFASSTKDYADFVVSGVGYKKKAVTITQEMLDNNVYFYGSNGDGYWEYQDFMVVEGDYTNTEIAYQSYFTGLKSASFGGIESTNADGTETATLDFPATEMPLGKTIDFENKKITDYGVTIELNGTESINYSSAFGNGSVFFSALVGEAKNAIGVCTDATVVQKKPSAVGDMQIGDGRSGANPVFWKGILAQLGFWASTDDNTTAIASFKAYLAKRYADGNPVTIRYISSVLQSETDFTDGNEYTAYKKGTEKVLDNDGAEYGADNAMTINYVFVSEVQQ